MTALTTERPEPAEPEPRPTDTIEPARGWSFPARFGLRFALAFLIPLNFDAFFSFLPYVGDYIYLVWSPFADRFFPLLTRTFFHIGPSSARSGSGDTAYNYAQIAVYAGLALVIATIWSLIDRRRMTYPRTLEVLRVCARLVLAEAMITYGASKVVPAQFTVPSTRHT